MCPECQHPTDRHDDGFGCTVPDCPCTNDRRSCNDSRW
jgi:hypothetical protein